MEALQVPSIWIESQDAQTPKSQEVEREVSSTCSHCVLSASLPHPAAHFPVIMQVALLSPFIQREVLRCGHGFAADNPVVLPKQVTALLNTLGSQYTASFLAVLSP